MRLHKAGQIAAVYFDPFQLHSISIDLIKAGVRMIELPQTGQRVEADQALYDAIIGRTIRHYDDPLLNEAIHNAVAVETPRGFRLAKERTSRKIDAAVALSMAHFGALHELKAIGEAQAIPNIFYGYEGASLDDFAVVNGRWAYLPERAAKHSPGATGWKDCRNRNRGCQACINELEESGYFDAENELAEIAKNNIVEIHGR